MGLGQLFSRPGGSEPVENRVITEFAVIGGQPVLGSEFVNDGYRGGMAIPGAYRAATLLADLLGSVPWHAYRQRAGNPVEQLPTPPLLEQPSPPDTRMTTISSWALDLIWHGNAIGVIAARNPEGWPTAVAPVPADYVQVRRVTGADNSPIPVGEIEYLINGTSYSAYEVIHIKGHCRPGELRGRGVLEQHFHTLELATEQSRQARSLVNHGVPTGIVNVTGDETTEELQAMKAGWQKSQRDRSVAFLSNAQWQTIAWNPTETQLLEARKFTLHELALIFGVPLSFLGVEQSSRTYTNVENEGLNLTKFSSLAGHLARFEQTLALQFPRGTWVKANLDSLLRSDTITRHQAHEIGIRAGFLTVDEARELEDRPPLTPEQRAELKPRPVPKAPTGVAP